MKKLNSIAVLLAFCTQIGFAQRVVLLEQFTNSGCSICANNDPTVYNYVGAHPSQIVAISYHTAFPYFDSMYLENIQESNARTAYYNVVAVPYSVIDGNYYTGSTPAFNPQISTVVGNRAAQAPAYNVIPLQNQLTGNVLQAKFAFQSLSGANLNDSLRAFVVVIEAAVLKSSYAASPGNSSLNIYNYVMRKMLPNANGSYLNHRNLNEIDTISLSWNLQHIKNKLQLRLVAFVQNTQTKEVYAATMVDPNTLTPVNTLTETAEISIFPNPAKDFISIALPREAGIIELTLCDIQGRKVYQSEARNQNYELIDLTGIGKGIYFLNLNVDGMNYRKKVVVLEN